MFIGFRHSWAYLFNNDPGRYLNHYFDQKLKIFKTEVVKLVASVLPIMGLCQVFDGWSAVTGGILRAKGKQVPTFCCYLYF
jgi:MATE family multidrug resistance protein